VRQTSNGGSLELAPGGSRTTRSWTWGDWVATLARGLRAREEPADRTVSPGLLAVTLAAFVAVLGLELMLEAQETVAPFLLIAPIGVVTLLYGSRTGLAAAGIAVAVAIGQAQLEGLAIGVTGYLTRAVVFLSVPVIVGMALTRQPSGTAELDSASTEVTALRSNGRPGRLTKREVEVLRLLALGHTNKEIAAQLYLSPRTVESHRANIQEKLHRSGRAELVRYALRHGLIGAAEQAEPNALAAAGHR
jgi:DNA-binding CsgD family transcriptional regulator